MQRPLSIDHHTDSQGGKRNTTSCGLRSKKVQFLNVQNVQCTKVFNHRFKCPSLPLKREIANCVLAAVYMPMELWASFYHCVEWQNWHASTHLMRNFLCILNVSHKIFEQLIHQNKPSYCG